MYSQDIRLRLVIRRHSLPELKLLWPCSCTEDFTVARLLELVNEVVTLESGEWGLEDYAVELADGKGGSFECLHFQQVGRILKDEDQIVIRSLLTGDLKRRRLSGRHQISDDGRHLVDGLAFGRPWLRTPQSRPQITLPPRKRARITYDPDDDDEEAPQEQLMIEAPGRSASSSKSKIVRISAPFDDISDSEDSEDDEDGSEASCHDSFIDGSFLDGSDDDSSVQDEGSSNNGTDGDAEDEEEDLQDELRFLKQDNATQTAYRGSEEEHEASSSSESGGNLQEAARLLRSRDETRELDLASKPSPKHWDGQGCSSDEDSENDQVVPSHSYEPTDGLIEAFILAIPSVSPSDVKSALHRANNDIRKAYLSLSMGRDVALNVDEVVELAVSIETSNPNTAQSLGSGRLKGLDGPPTSLLNATKASGVLGKRSRPLIEEVGDVGEAGSSDNESDSDDSDASSSSSESEDESVSDDSESDQGQDSDDDSSSSSAMQSGDENAQDPEAAKSPSRDGSPDESDSDDEDSDNHANEDGADAKGSIMSSGDDSSDDSSSDSSTDSESESESDSESDDEPEEISSKPLIQELPEVQLNSNITPDDELLETHAYPLQSSTRTQKRNARRRRSKMLKKLQVPGAEPVLAEQISAPTDDLQARKQALLASILDQHPDASIKPPEALQGSTEDESMKDAPTADGAEQAEQNFDTQNQLSTLGETPAQRRSRFDLGAGRRLLFGALGLKTPKTKADEQKLREQLEKDVRPLPTSNLVEEVVDGDANNGVRDDGKYDGWRDKIFYRAVECCHDDMELTEPPFPFIQRWDPQQKYGSMRKRKRASEVYEQDTSYADGSYYQEDLEAVEDEAGRKKRKNKNKNRNKKDGNAKHEGQPDEHMNEDCSQLILNYDDVPTKSSQITDMDDLPSLPADVTVLPMLELGAATPGMVLTWKQLLMSKATKWQPEVVSMTGLVIPGGEGSTIHVMLAKRDRETPEINYDDITGERLYDKFEVPDLDEGYAEDTGFRELQWAEMMETRLVQHEPITSTENMPLKTNGALSGSGPPLLTDMATDEEVSNPEHVKEFLANQTSVEQTVAVVDGFLALNSSDDSDDHPESISIQSGQRMPRPELSTGGDEFLVSTSSDSWETLKYKNSDSSRTVECALNNEPVGAASPENATGNIADAIEEEDRTDADQEAELGPNLADAAAGGISDSEQLVRKPSQPSDTEKPVDQDVYIRQANKSDAIVPSSPASLGNGRRVQNQGIIEGEEEEGDEAEAKLRESDSIIPETLPQLRDHTPIPNDTKQQDHPVMSSSPFPSVEELFMTAKQTQSPVRGQDSLAVSSRTEKPINDLAYEEAMRKLDEGDESDDLSDKNGEVATLFPHATQPPKCMGQQKEEPPSESGSPVQTPKKQRKQSPFKVPAGSQVVVLSSSSPSSGGEPEGKDVNEKTLARRNILPAGPGWVRKSATDGGWMRGRRKSVPATDTSTAARRARRVDGLPPPPATVGTASKYKGVRRSNRHASWQK